MARTKTTKRFSDPTPKVVLVMSPEDVARKARRTEKWRKKAVDEMRSELEYARAMQRYYRNEASKINKGKNIQSTKDQLEYLNDQESNCSKQIEYYTEELKRISNPPDEHPGVEPQSKEDDGDQGGPGGPSGPSTGLATGPAMVAV